MLDRSDYENTSEQEFSRFERESYQGTDSSDENLEILIGFTLFAMGWCSNGLPGVLIGLGIATYFLIAFLSRRSSGEEGYERHVRSRAVESNQIQNTSNAPITNEPTIAEKIESIHKQNDFKCPSCGATVLPIDIRCKHCGSVLITAIDLPRPAKWGDVEVGQSVQLQHPEKGQINLPVIHRMIYGELWQAQMKPDVPWTLTGNYYVGLGLENGNFLLNWQSRFYLLDSSSLLTDKDINQTFAKPAREFAASNQSRNVSFTYNRTVWMIEDIGRFRIEWVHGEGAKAPPGAVGRFIHAKAGNQVLVIEDYQSSGGGVDTLWIGYQIVESDIHI
jgi:predicted RNA-binding Zn-ribbon protein involved in translation (DUF1610 family)